MAFVKEFVPLATGVMIGVTPVGDNAEPLVIMTFPLIDGDEVTIGIAVDAMEDVLLAFANGMVRAKTIVEMITTWPEQRDQILRNLLFRWSGVVDNEEGDDGQ